MNQRKKVGKSSQLLLFLNKCGGKSDRFSSFHGAARRECAVGRDGVV